MTKVLVIGASDATGKLLVFELLQRNIEVVNKADKSDRSIEVER